MEAPRATTTVEKAVIETVGVKHKFGALQETLKRGSTTKTTMMIYAEAKPPRPGDSNTNLKEIKQYQRKDFIELIQ